MTHVRLPSQQCRWFNFLDPKERPLQLVELPWTLRKIYIEPSTALLLLNGDFVGEDIEGYRTLAVVDDRVVYLRADTDGHRVRPPVPGDIKFKQNWLRRIDCDEGFWITERILPL